MPHVNKKKGIITDVIKTITRPIPVAGPIIDQILVEKKAKVKRGRNRGQGGSNPGGAAPAANPGLRSSTKPSSLPPKIGGISRLSRREFVGDFAGETEADFVSSGYFINPANESLFPWLCSTARSYQMYRFHKLRFTYAPSSGSTETGYVGIYVDADAVSSPTVTTKAEAMDFASAVRSNAWGTVTYSVDPQVLSLRKWYFTSSSDASLTGIDNSLSHTGIVNFFQGGNASTGVIGELWVEYDVEFDVMLPPEAAATANTSGMSAVSGMSNTNIFGTSRSHLGTLPYTVSGNVLTFNRYVEAMVMTLSQSGTSFGPGPSVAASGGTATFAKMFPNGCNGDGKHQLCVFYGSQLDIGNTVTFTEAATPTYSNSIVNNIICDTSNLYTSLSAIIKRPRLRQQSIVQNRHKAHSIRPDKLENATETEVEKALEEEWQEQVDAYDVDPEVKHLWLMDQRFKRAVGDRKGRV